MYKSIYEIFDVYYYSVELFGIKQQQHKLPSGLKKLTLTLHVCIFLAEIKKGRKLFSESVVV